MPDAKKEEAQKGPACMRCKSLTQHHRRIFDPANGKKYDLHECATCGNQSWSPVTERKQSSQ